MDILVLQGPNFNLIGVQSANAGERITLDKMNRVVHRHAHSINLDIQLRFLQTHKADKAISFIHRNRNKASGILIAPASWGRYEYSILDALHLSGLPSVQILLDHPYSLLNKADSIFTPVCNETVVGHPLSAFNSALDALQKHIS